jgi:hypothetical protein
MLSGLGTLAMIAANDPSFALEPDYYQKAVSYDDELRQQDENRRLGWTLELTAEPSSVTRPSRIVLVAADGRGPITGANVEARALRNAMASIVLTGSFQETGPGRYEAELPLARGGLWEFRFVLVRGGERYTERIRRDVAGPP